MQVVTDMFVLKGWYSSLTICIYGYVMSRDPAVSPSMERSLSDEPVYVQASPSDPPSVRSEHHQEPQQLQQRHLQDVPVHQHIPPRPPEVGPRRDHHPPPPRSHHVSQHAVKAEKIASQAESSSSHHGHTAAPPAREHQAAPAPERSPKILQPSRSDPVGRLETRATLLPPLMPSGTPSSQVSRPVESSRADIAPAVVPLSVRNRSSAASSTASSSTTSASSTTLRTTIKEESKEESRSLDHPPVRAASDMKVITLSRISEDPLPLTRTIINTKVESNTQSPAVFEKDADDGDGDSSSSDETSDEEMGLEDGGLEGGPQLDLEMFGDDDSWMSLPVGFNPYEEIELMPLNGLAPCHRTAHEARLLQLHTRLAELPPLPEAAKQLCGLIQQMQACSDPLQWLLMLEKLPSLCDIGLADVIHHEPSLPTVSFLSETVIRSVSWTVASELPLAVNTRQLKAGIRLFSVLAECGGQATESLLSVGGLEALCQLLKVDGLASSIKIVVLRAIDVALDFPLGMEHFLGWTSPGTKETCYQILLSFVLQHHSVRVMQCCKVLLNKTHCYELLARLQERADVIAASACPLKVPSSSNAMDWQDGVGTASSCEIQAGSEPLDTSHSPAFASPMQISSDASTTLNGRIQRSQGQSSAEDSSSQQSGLPSELEGDEETPELVLNEELALEMANFALVSLGKLLAIFHTADEMLVSGSSKFLQNSSGHGSWVCGQSLMSWGELHC